MKFLLPFILLAGSAWGQSFVDSPHDFKSKVLGAEGQLITIQIVKNQPLRIYVVGKEEAKIDLKDLKLTVRRLKPYPAQFLSLDREGNYFSLKEPVDTALPKDIEVTAKLGEKSETFQFKLNNKSP